MNFAPSIIRATLLLAGFAGTTSPTRAQSSYTLTDLGTLPGFIHSYATGMNASGQITGDPLRPNPFKIQFPSSPHPSTWCWP